MFPAENKWFKDLFSELDELNAVLRSEWLDSSGNAAGFADNADGKEVAARLISIKDALDAVTHVIGERGYPSISSLSKVRFEDIRGGLFKDLERIEKALWYLHDAASVLAQIDLEAAGVKDVDGLEKFLVRGAQAYKQVRGVNFALSVGKIMILENFTGRVDVDKGKSVFVRIAYDPAVRLEEQTLPAVASIISYCRKNDKSLRDVIEWLNRRIFDAANYAFKNPLFEPVFGEIFKKDLNVYVVGQRRDTALISKVKKIFRLRGKKIPVMVVPGGQLLRVFFNVESLIDNSELELGSALFHELIHLTDRNLNIADIHTLDRIRGEGLAIFSEALFRPRERLSGGLKQCWINGKVFFSLSSLSGLEMYQLGMLICIDLFLERIGKLKEIRSMTDRERSFEAVLALLETRRKDGELLVRAIRALSIKNFFEFFFRKCGLPPFMGPQFGMDIASRLESEYITDRVMETWERKSA